MRRGFLWRSGWSSPDNPDTRDWWDPDNFIFGGERLSTGYSRNRVHDRRFRFNNPFPWFPAVEYQTSSITAFIHNLDTKEKVDLNINFWNDISLSSTLIEELNCSLFQSDFIPRFELKSILSKGAFINLRFTIKIIQTGNYTLSYYSFDGGQTFVQRPDLDELFEGMLAYEIVDDNIYILVDSGNIYTYNLIDGTTGEFTNPFGMDIKLASFHKTDDRLLLLIQDTDNQIMILESWDGKDFSLLLEDIEFGELQGETVDYSLATNDIETVLIAISTQISGENTYQNVYLARAFYGEEDENYGFDGTIPVAREFTMSIFPNPFNPETMIEFYLPENDFVNLEVFNIRGQRVKTIVSERLMKGSHSFVFDARNLSSGIYFVRLSSERYSHASRVLLLK